MKSTAQIYDRGPGGRLQKSIMAAVESSRLCAAHPDTYLIEPWEPIDGPAPSAVLFWVYDIFADPIAAVTIDGPRIIWDAILQPNGTVLKDGQLFASMEAYKADAARGDAFKRAVEERRVPA